MKLQNYRSTTGDLAGAAAGARPQPLEDRELRPLGAGRRHGRGPDAEPDLGRAGVPRRHPAHRPGHRAPHGRRPLAQGTDGNCCHERQVSARNAGQRDRQISRAKALDAPQFHIDIALSIIHIGIVGCP